jgi:hypothetical protein
MEWSDIKIGQFQQLQEIDSDISAIDKLFETVSICHGIPLDELDVMPQHEFNKLAKEVEFTATKPFTAVMQKRFKNYRFVPDIRQIKSGVSRYIEIKHWNKNHIPNMHLIIASMVQPQKRNWLGLWRNVKYESKDYEKYASELQHMPITTAMAWIGFFLQVSERSRKDLETYLRSKMILKIMWKYKMNKNQVEEIVMPLWQTTDGSIK